MGNLQEEIASLMADSVNDRRTVCRSFSSYLPIVAALLCTVVSAVVMTIGD